MADAFDGSEQERAQRIARAAEKRRLGAERHNPSVVPQMVRSENPPE
jgi:hypothetical protein